MIVIAFAAAAVMASVVAVTLIAVVVSVRGEDRRGELPHRAPTVIARGVRKLTGLRVCQAGEAGSHLAPFTQKATGRVHRAHPVTSPAQVIDQPSSTQTGNRRSA
jgi:hypothetical protein